MSDAPLYDTLCEAPEGGRACWIHSNDDVRLRAACWHEGSKGTVLLFPGRTEFIEKYGRTIADFGKRGFATAIIDWRGQGLSDRLVSNRNVGHVSDFGDYQLDVAAFLDFAEKQDLPKPWFLCTHSMGGTIGLRALHSGLPVRKAAFLAPMWGLMFDPIVRPIIQAIAAGTKSVGWGAEFSPGTGPENYIISSDFEGNTLTSDRDTWDYIRGIMSSHPGLAIGGPSIHWLYEALVETRALSKLPPPDFGVLCLLGNDESVVDKRDVVNHMVHWPGARLEMIKGAHHEILMEKPGIKTLAMEMLENHFCD